MGVTVLPYIDQTQTARLQEAASANIQTPKNTDEAVTTFKECLASAERSVQAMAVDALLAASNSGAVSLDTVQQILGFTPQTDAPVDTSPVADTFTSSSSSANTTAANATSSGSVSSPENLEEYFKEASETYGVDITLLKAIARQESNFTPSATSSAGAMCVMQLMPSTAKGLGVTNAYDAQENIMGGAKLMAQNLKKYNGDVSRSLAAYNAGSGNVDKYGGIPPFKETQNYVKKVLGYYQNGVDIPSQTSSAQASATDTEGLSADERQNIYRQMLSLTNQLILDKLEA